jgi:hypothetical protein
MTPTAHDPLEAKNVAILAEASVTTIRIHLCSTMAIFFNAVVAPLATNRLVFPAPHPSGQE